MKNIRLYSSKTIKILFMINRKYGSKNYNKSGIPVIVLDLKTNKSIKYRSITEAAKSLATHPKTIWRKLQYNKLYLDRYLIKKHLGVMDSIIPNVMGKASIRFRSPYINYVVLLYTGLILVLLGYILCKYIPPLIGLFINSSNYNVDNQLNHILEKDRSLKNNIFNCINSPITDKVKGLAEFNKEWLSVDILKNKTSFIHGFTSRPTPGIGLGIYIPVNEVDTWSRNVSSIISTVNSTSAIASTNTVFPDMVASTHITATAVDTITTPNSLVLHPTGSYRNSSIIDNTLLGPRSPGRQILNYNSNVLYCLINGIPTPTPIIK
jgi:hypothetical protein